MPPGRRTRCPSRTTSAATAYILQANGFKADEVYQLMLRRYLISRLGSSGYQRSSSQWSEGLCWPVQISIAGGNR